MWVLQSQNVTQAPFLDASLAAVLKVPCTSFRPVVTLPQTSAGRLQDLLILSCCSETTRLSMRLMMLTQNPPRAKHILTPALHQAHKVDTTDVFTSQRRKLNHKVVKVMGRGHRTRGAVV